MAWRGMWWEGDVEGTGKIKSEYKIVIGKHEGETSCDMPLQVDGKITLKLILKAYDTKKPNVLIWSSVQ
jgi:hypothetical protein